MFLLRPRPIRARRRAAAALAILGMVVLALAPGAVADTRSNLDAARIRLAQLEQNLNDQRALADSLREDLNGIQDDLGQAQTALQDLKQAWLDTSTALEAARAEYAAARDRLDLRARDLFVAGPGGGLETLLGATSLTDLSDRMQYVDSVGKQDASLASQVQARALDLQVQAAALQAAATRRTALIARLRNRQEALAATFNGQQQAVRSMQGTRRKILRLLNDLQAKLKAEEIAAARRSISGVPVEYGPWARGLLDALHVPACQDNEIVVVAWETAEGTQAAFNPLATTYITAGSTLFNSAGVRNYPSLSEGVQATVATIDNGFTKYGYGAIVSSLASCADPMTTALAINASSWCRGCVGGAYVINVVAAVAAFYRG